MITLLVRTSVSRCRTHSTFGFQMSRELMNIPNPPEPIVPFDLFLLALTIQHTLNQNGHLGDENFGTSLMRRALRAAQNLDRAKGKDFQASWPPEVFS